ncbi:MAG: heavy metal translocating P-type ATPase, partial [Pseudomonadales bacterium]
MAEHLLAIEGMSCAGCVSSVEAALKSVPGVADASINYAQGSALVSGEVPMDALLIAVQQAGYGASASEARDGDDTHEDLRKMFLASLARSAAALIVGALLMADMHWPFLPAKSNLIFWGGMTVLIACVMWVTGGQFYSRAITATARSTATMDTLIALGTGVAFVYSLLALFWPELLPQEARHLYFEAAVFVIGFVALGKALENNATGKASLAVRKLLDLAPKTVTLMTNGKEETIPLSQVKPGDLLKVRPGENIPADGLVVDGITTIDESTMTGEFLPVDKMPGDTVTAGTTNQLGMVHVEAKQVGEQTRLAQMVRLVRQAQNTKPAIGRTVDRVAAIFVPSVILIAAASALAWWLFGPAPKLPFMLVTTMSVLVIACPCALGLAVPISIMVGMGRAAELGLLIKDGEALQAASNITMMIVDKTGTLTEGRLEVVSVAPAAGKAPAANKKSIDANETTMLQTAYSLEQASEHPIGIALANYCKACGLAPTPASNIQILPGGGIKGTIDGDKAVIGNAAFLTAEGIEVSGGQVASQSQEPNQAQGKTQILISRAGKLLGTISLTDQLKPSAANTVKALQAMNIKVVMLTGDNPSAAEAVAAQLNNLPFQAEA